MITSTHCWPIGGCDRELERLRELERQADVAEEKRRIRERLWRRGINPDYPPCVPMRPMPLRPCVPIPTPCYPPFVWQPVVPAQPSIGDVLRRLG